MHPGRYHTARCRRSSHLYEFYRSSGGKRVIVHIHDSLAATVAYVLHLGGVPDATTRARVAVNLGTVDTLLTHAPDNP